MNRSISQRRILALAHRCAVRPAQLAARSRDASTNELATAVSGAEPEPFVMPLVALGPDSTDRTARGRRGGGA